MLSSLPDSRHPHPSSRPARLEICPPSRERPAQDWLARVRCWLASGWPGASAPPDEAAGPPLLLAQARQDFLDAVADISTPAADLLLDRIEFARSMRELWHLRADVFAQVSLVRNQREADERLAWLNRHFPTRSPRSGFGALTPKDMWP